MPIVNLSAGLRATMGEITTRNGDAPDLVGRLRTGILNQIIQFRNADGTVAVHYESDVTTYHHPDTQRAWKYDELRTTVDASANVNQEAFLDKPMRSPRPSALINITIVVPSAFEELKPGMNCAIDQLSKHLDLPYEEVKSEMLPISQELYDSSPKYLQRACVQNARRVSSCIVGLLFGPTQSYHYDGDVVYH
ncbi:hypothetical protein N9L68_03955 [bacterium]|nr:hypothetical protein [bacterium]